MKDMMLKMLTMKNKGLKDAWAGEQKKLAGVDKIGDTVEKLENL